PGCSARSSQAAGSAAARGLLVVAGGAEASGQLGRDAAQGEAPEEQAHHRVVEEIGRLRVDALVALAGDGVGQLPRLLAQLLADLGRALVEQRAGVAPLGRAADALLEHALEAQPGRR